MKKIESRKKSREEMRREKGKQGEASKQASKKHGTMPLTTYLSVLNLYFSYENIYLSLLKTRF